MNKSKQNKGFIAFMTILMIVSAVTCFSFVVLSSAYEYADIVYRKGLRTQANFNLDSCMIYAKFLYAQNYFLVGKVDIDEFHCRSKVLNDFVGNATIFATSTLGDISLVRKISFHNNGFVVESVLPE